MDGIKIVYTGDTRKVDLSKFAFQADYLFHEAAEVDEKNAEKSGHTTPLQAAKIAKEAQVKNLVLIHRPEFDTDLINKIKENNITFKLIDDFDIDGDFIESQAFAYLAIRSYLKLPISFPETTGCNKPCTGGVIIENF